VIGPVLLVACSGPDPDDGTDQVDVGTDETAIVPTGATGSAPTAETGTPPTPAGWVLTPTSFFDGAAAVTVGVAANAADATFVIDVIRPGGEHELWLHTGRWWRDGLPPVQLLDDADASDVFVPSIRARDGATHVLTRVRCGRTYPSCPDPEAMKLVELEIPDGWDGLSALTERPVTPVDAISDGQSQLVPDGDELSACHTVHTLGDEVECRVRPAAGGDWSPGVRISAGVPGADDHPCALVTAAGERLVGYTSSATGQREVRLALGPGQVLELGMDLQTGLPVPTDWLTLAQEPGGAWAALWTEEPTPVRQLVVGRCAAGSLAGCGTLGAWDRARLDPDTPGPQNHPNLAAAPGGLLASWERTEAGGTKRIRFALACDAGDTTITDVDPEGAQSKIYGFPGMVYEPTTDVVHLAYVRDRGAGFELVWASLYHPAGACP
jgi:hypothetical protein